MSNDKKDLTEVFKKNNTTVGDSEIVNLGIHRQAQDAASDIEQNYHRLIVEIGKSITDELKYNVSKSSIQEVLEGSSDDRPSYNSWGVRSPAKQHIVNKSYTRRLQDRTRLKRYDRGIEQHNDSEKSAYSGNDVRTNIDTVLKMVSSQNKVIDRIDTKTTEAVEQNKKILDDLQEAKQLLEEANVLIESNSTKRSLGLVTFILLCVSLGTAIIAGLFGAVIITFNQAVLFLVITMILQAMVMLSDRI